MNEDQLKIYREKVQKLFTKKQIELFQSTYPIKGFVKQMALKGLKLSLQNQDK